MKRRMTTVLFLLLAGLSVQAGFGQKREERVISSSISYLSAGTVYLDAGRTRGLETGDTLTVVRQSQPLGIIVITAVSSSSASAATLSQAGPFAVGDSAWTRKSVLVQEAPPAGVAAGAVVQTSSLPASSQESNIVNGRVALQYGAVGNFSDTLQFSQTAALVRLDVARLFGTGLVFTIYGRTSYDLADHIGWYQQGSRRQTRMYELSLSYEDPQAWYGYGIGRIYSRFVGGLGTFDGGHAFVRTGQFTIGVLGGCQPDYVNSSVNTDQLKFSAFANYAWGEDIFTRSDLTLAYGQQRAHGELDRDFVYFQTSLRFGPGLFVYASSELDLHSITNGQMAHDPSLTNTFVTLNYLPLNWLTLTAGYDAARAIYLFESMKSIADTLLDRTLKEGFRGSLTFRLPYNLSLTTSGNVRLASGTTGAAHTVAGTLRAFDIAGSQINAGVHGASVQGLYTSGDDITFDIDTWFDRSLFVGLKLDRYHYQVRDQSGTFTTTTGTANVQYLLSRSLYGVVTFDQVWDDSRTFQRLFLEVGVHF